MFWGSKWAVFRPAAHVRLGWQRFASLTRACANAAPESLIDSESSRVVGSGEVALWRAVLEQALNEACLLRFNPGVNRNPTPASRERDRDRAAASDWFKSGGRDFALVCDFADLPAVSVQDHAYGRFGTPAEKRSRTCAGWFGGRRRMSRSPDNPKKSPAGAGPSI